MKHSPKLKTLLNSLTYDPHAQQQSCILPLGGIYWDDELPDSKALASLSDEERYYPFSILAIRRKLWAKEPLSKKEQKQWEWAQAHYPGWPVFQRTRITEHDYQRQLECEQKALQLFESMFAEADEVNIQQTGEGALKWSAKFNLDEEQPETKTSTEGEKSVS